MAIGDYDGDAISDFEWFIAEGEDRSDEGDYCPDCGAELQYLWNGVKCSNPNCDYWFDF